MKKNRKLEKMLLNFFSSLEKNKVKFAVIGNYDRLPYYTTNDIDLYVNDYLLAENLLHKTAKELNINLYLLNRTANGSNNYFYYCDNEKNINVIKIDLMCETAWISMIPIIPSDIIEKNIVKYKTFYVVDKELESCMHLLYPLVTYGIVKEKYKEKLYDMSRNELFILNLSKILGFQLSKYICNLLSVKNWNKIEKTSYKIRKKLMFNFLKELLKVHRLKVIVKFLKSIIFRFFSCNGIMISFTGIDGAGKTTIKEKLLDESEKYFLKAKTKEFYWRPFLLPKPSFLFRKKSSLKEQYNKSGRRIYKDNWRNNIISYLKYVYYVSDFVLGQIKYIRSLKTGGIVIFDRYHLDNIIYPERFGFRINKNVMRIIDKFIIPQPDILFYLTADTKVLYERKREISIDEINKQKLLYKKEQNFNKSIIEIDTSVSFEKSYNEILLYCLDKMAKRYENA